MGDAQLQQIIEYIMENDLEFYEKYLSDLTPEELQIFLNENPDFLNDY